MHMQKLILVFSLLFISIGAQDKKKRICIHNLVLDGTNLISLYRKNLLVLGITNFKNETSRVQANRYNDMLRQLQNYGIRGDSAVRFILINEQDGAHALPGKYYDKIRLYQDNPKENLVKKLRRTGRTIDTFVFGRCGYLVYTQEHQKSNLDNSKNYQELLRNIKLAVRNKRSCQRLCS